ncbi:MAG: inositol monophosphatase family protein [Pseudomonadota bacterium]
MHDESALSNLEEILQTAARIGKVWRQKRAELTFDEKSIGQFASNADLEIEHNVRGALAQAFPGQAIIGEEMGGALSDDQTGWAIDPIDGTSNFILGLPIWAISIGYVVRGDSVLGALSLPDLDLTLSAETGSGLRLNGVPVQAIPPPAAVKVIALGENDFEPGLRTDEIAQGLRAQNYAVVRYRCAVFSLAMSALGRLSGYVENGCGLWDIAAAGIICQEAGMDVTSNMIAPGRYAIDARWPAETSA